VASVIESIPIKAEPDLPDIIDADRLARKEALRCMTVLSS
jgi:hypothetical protein